jgi:DNA-binding MarR family transcriptional regulator
VQAAHRYTISLCDTTHTPFGLPHCMVRPDLEDMRLDQADFEHLLQLRTGLRRFLRWSELQAQAVGITPAQHQLLLAVRGHPNPAGPTVGEVAEYLVLRHHSASELIARAGAAGLVERTSDSGNGSIVRVLLTPAGADKLEELAEVHLEELSQLAPTMRALWRTLERASPGELHPAPAPRRSTL